MRRIVVASVVTVLLAVWGFGSVSRSWSEPAPSQRQNADGPQLRRPVVVIANGNRILVGNRASGTISVIDPSTGSLTAEHHVAKRIADITPLPNSADLFVLDDESKRLLKVTLQDNHTQVHPIADVPADAVKLALSPSRHRLFVNSKWSRQLTAIDFDAGYEQVKSIRTVSLPFASHEMLLLDEAHRLLVADAFAGRVTVVDAADLRQLGMRTLSGHNIRGLSLDADQTTLLVAQQQIVPAGRADYEELHWGRLVTNGVEQFDLREFIAEDTLQTDTDTVMRGWVDEFGGIGAASADPAAVVSTGGNVMAVCLSGSNEVTIRAGGNARRVPVGRRPVAIAIIGGQLYVANQFDDSVSVIQLKSGQVQRTISLGETPQLTAAQRGEMLFFDASLSHDAWMSCHSCHTDGHSAGLLIDTLGDGDYGAPKRVPSLLGTHESAPWGWTGGKPTLSDQIQASVTTTMHGDRLNARQLADLESYLNSLSPPPTQPAPAELLSRGRELFKTHQCVSCHTPPTYTTAATFDVGLTDEKGRRTFNPPSLRGVGHRSRLFHDARAANLDEVLNRFGHQLKEPLEEADTKALLAFLRSL